MALSNYQVYTCLCRSVSEMEDQAGQELELEAQVREDALAAHSAVSSRPEGGGAILEELGVELGDELQAQAVEMLLEADSTRREKDALRGWREDGGTRGVYAGCRALYSLAMKGTKLLNLLKVLVAEGEYYVCESCSAKDMGGQHSHLTVQTFEALLAYTSFHFPNTKRLRLKLGKGREYDKVRNLFTRTLGFKRVPERSWLCPPGEGFEFFWLPIETLENKMATAVHDSPPTHTFECGVYAGLEHDAVQAREMGDARGTAQGGDELLSDDGEGDATGGTSSGGEAAGEAIGGSGDANIEGEDANEGATEDADALEEAARRALEDEDELESALGEIMAGLAKAGVSASWGAVNVVEVLKVWLRYLWRNEVVLPGSASQTAGVSPSLDAACLRNASKGAKHWTTVILQILTKGVTKECWGQAAVKHMLFKPHSPYNMAKLRFWEGKDDLENVSPSMLQL